MKSSGLQDVALVWGEVRVTVISTLCVATATNVILHKRCFCKGLLLLLPTPLLLLLLATAASTTTITTTTIATTTTTITSAAATKPPQLLLLLQPLLLHPKATATSITATIGNYDYNYDYSTRSSLPPLNPDSQPTTTIDSKTCKAKLCHSTKQSLTTDQVIYYANRPRKELHKHGSIRDL